MFKKLFLTLFITIIFSPLSLAQDDSVDTSSENADVQEDASADEQAVDDEQPATDDQSESAETSMEGVTASTKYTCEQQGATRRVEIHYEVPNSTVPCSVNYYKDTEVPGEVNTLWTANNADGYCEEKAAALVDKLKSAGWDCQDN